MTNKLESKLYDLSVALNGKNYEEGKAIISKEFAADIKKHGLHDDACFDDLGKQFKNGKKGLMDMYYMPKNFKGLEGFVSYTVGCEQVDDDEPTLSSEGGYWLVAFQRNSWQCEVAINPDNF